MKKIKSEIMDAVEFLINNPSISLTKVSQEFNIDRHTLSKYSKLDLSKYKYLYNDEWYYLNNDGSMKSGEWLKQNNDWYYISYSGIMRRGSNSILYPSP